jgi:hypothetical protein
MQVGQDVKYMHACRAVIEHLVLSQRRHLCLICSAIVKVTGQVFSGYSIA